MRTLNNDTRNCAKPEIIAGRLTSIRNIYLRQELDTISIQIQENYKERLPILHLVSLAAYEQVFNRQPLSSPEELRRNAVKYGLRYYQLNIDRLRMAEAKNGLYPNHDRLSCSDKRCPLHVLNLSDSQSSTSLQKTKSEHISTGSSLTSKSSDNTFDSTSNDTDSITSSVSSDKSSTITTNEYDFSSTSTFDDTNISISSTDAFSNKSLNSSASGSLSESSSDTHQPSKSTKILSRTKPPKIIVRRASDNNLTPSKTKNSSTHKRSVDIHRLSPHKQKKRKKNKRT